MRCSNCGQKFEKPIWKEDRCVFTDVAHWKTTYGSAYTAYGLFSATTFCTWRGWILACPYCGTVVEKP